MAQAVTVYYSARKEEILLLVTIQKYPNILYLVNSEGKDSNLNNM